MNAIEQKLRARRAELMGEIAERDDEIAIVEIEDQEDKNTERLEDEVRTALSESDQAEVARLDAALARIANGTYGICAECEERISPQRLAAQPDAILCIDCASKA